VTARDESVRGPLGFRVGDFVEIKSKEEILATLDELGEMGSLPFMPEMLEYCGQQVRVFRRAVKTCDPGHDARFRRMHGAVHLQDLRCDGSAHGGCEARCLLYWREEWLRPVGQTATSVSPTTAAADDPARGITEADLGKTTKVFDDELGETVYRCQATEVKRAAPEVIKDWDLRSWVRDVRSGNVGLPRALRVFIITLFNVFQRANQKLLPRVPLIHGAGLYPFVSGRLKTTTPRGELNLRPGEVVRIKSLEEIEATLDTNGRNRGMAFDRNMVKHCGSEARVVGTVDRIIDPGTGRMITMANECIVLEDIYCQKVLCPKSEYTYWRAVWLERVEAGEKGSRSVPEAAGA
jgi:hypothetical protein